MKTDWPVMTIAQCAAAEQYSTQIGPFGKALTPADYTSSGVPLLRGVNVNHGRFYDDDFVFISDETASRFTKYESHPGDVLLVHKGTLGKIGLMPRDRKYKKYIMGNSMLRVKCNPDLLIPEYLYYWLSSVDGQNYLFSRVSQVGVPQLQTPLKTLREAALPIPPLPVQRGIAKVLVSLDEKIELNLRMNETLESIARAVFRSWFVDFDPVRAKVNGRKPDGLDAATAKLFPDTFEESALGPVPKGWRVGSVADLCVKLENGGTPRRDTPSYWQPPQIPWLTSGEVRQGIITSTANFISEEGLKNSSSKLWESFCSVVALYGATAGQVCLLAERVCANQACCGLIPVPHARFYLYLKVSASTAKMEQLARGSAQQNLSQQIVSELPVVIPSEQVHKAFDGRVAAMFHQMIMNIRQSSTLAAIRDALLPKLLSGEVRPG